MIRTSVARRLRWGGAIALVLVLAWLGLLAGRAYVRRNVDADRALGLPIVVQVAPATVEEITDVIGATSAVEALSTVELKALVGARIEWMGVDIGDQVRAGQTVVRLDVLRLQATVEEARGDAARARAEVARAEQASTERLEFLRAAVAAARDGLQRAASELARTRTAALTLPDELRTAQSAAADELERARAELATATRLVERLRVLHERQVIARVELEAAETRLVAARAAHADARHRLQRANNELANVEATVRAMTDAAEAGQTAARGQLAQAERDLVLHPSVARAEVEGARFLLARALEGLVAAEDDLRRATIAAPVDGVVLERRRTVGETPSPSEVVLTLGTIDSLHVVARVAEEHVSHVAVGTAAEVVLDAFPNERFTGRVVKIDPSTRLKTRTFETYVRVDNRAGRLRPGLSGYTRIEWRRQALLVPRLAVVKNADEAMVFVAREGLAHLTPVQTVAVPGARTEIVSGLAEGDLVIHYPVLKLRDRDRIRVEPGPAR